MNFRRPYNQKLEKVENKSDILTKREWYFSIFLRDPIYNDGHLVRIIQALSHTNSTEIDSFTFNQNSTLRRNMSNFKDLQKANDDNCIFEGNFTIHKNLFSQEGFNMTALYTEEDIF